MFYCDKCEDTNCCERTDLPKEPVLCDKCYYELLRKEDIKNLKLMEKVAVDMLKSVKTKEGKQFLENELVAIRKNIKDMVD